MTRLSGDRWLRGLCLVTLVQTLLASAAFAQQRYVSDELVITFRTGPSPENAISRNLTSGERVEVIDELVEEGYSQVRLADGATGWVLTRYLQTEPTAAIELGTAVANLETAQQQLTALTEQQLQLETQLAEALALLESSQSSAETAGAELAEIREVSANALQLRDDNAALLNQMNDVNVRLEAATAEIDALRRGERQNWFIIGAAVLLAGIVVGLIAPSLRPKRRSSW